MKSLPLAAASARLRGRPGRPRRVLGQQTAGVANQGAHLTPAAGAGNGADFAVSLPARGLSVEASGVYLGLPVRSVWRLVRLGVLRGVRWPGLRRVLFDKRDLDDLFSEVYKGK